MPWALLTAQTRLLRFPDLHGDQVVFTYAGDLWKAPLGGGLATRLTAAPGVETFAKFSPDGRWIAFTGQLDGDEQVFIVPSEGGEPRQLTFYPARGPLPDRWGYDNQVYGWTPDGSAVLFRSLRDAWSVASGRLYTVAMPAVARQRGALPVALPLPVAGAGEFSPDGQRLVYSPLCRDFRTWKRYAGGWAQDLYLFDPTTGAATNLTNHPRTDRDPMWIGDRIWFASDRTGTLNLWSHDLRGNGAHQETSSTTWDVRWASAGGPNDQRIVYEKGGELWWFDCVAHQETAIAIRVPDDGALVRPTQVDATSRIESFALSPGGRRAAFAARGEVLTVPKEHGDVRNLTASPGAHDKWPSFAPDGSTIAFVSDRSGEEQIWLVDHLGAAPPRPLTKGLAGMLYQPSWAPDGTAIACSDKDGVLRVFAVPGGEPVVVDDEARGQLLDHTWSPCSGWLAYSKTRANDTRGLCLWQRATGTVHRISSPLNDDHTPAFAPDGERLWFLGRRATAPRLPGALEWDFQVDRATGVFAMALRAGVGPWLPPRSDEAVTPPAAPPAAEPFRAPITIDVEGLAERVEMLPLPLDNYAGLIATTEAVLTTRAGGAFYGRDSDQPRSLLRFTAKDRRSEEVASEVGGLALAPDRTFLLATTSGKHQLFDLATGKAAGTLDLRGLPVTKVPSEEYWQIFHEVWRRYRDFFYVANLHGHDWEALRERYAPLVSHVRHRSDLNYLLGEMVAELNVGHAYVSGGDLGAPARPTAALPGLRLEFDAANRAYRIASILTGANDDPVYRSPATAVGVQLAVGDYVLAIEGQDLEPERSPEALLRRHPGKVLTLLVNQRPLRDGARAVRIEPIADEQKLLYRAFVERNRARVSALSQGRLGYVHLPDMGADGLREFIRQYYPQRDQQGLLLDDRGNGGGNISQMVLARLQRRLLLCTFGRTTGYRPYPQALFHGHLACLLDETSASDGDIFPAMFRKAGLGPLIGKRSWGGIIGITDRGPLLDGGTVNVPEFGNTEPGPEWTIEGHGVEPDVVVENDVAAVLQGRDPQLEKGVALLLEAIAKDPRPLPTPPPPPVKTGR